MRTRFLSSLILVPVVLAAAKLGGTAWAVLLAVAAARAAQESLSLTSAAGRRPTTVVGLILAPALTLTSLRPDLDLLRPALAVAVIAALAVQIGRRPAERSAADWAATLAGPIYVGILLGYGVLLREMADGLAWTGLLLALVWSNDTAAYLGGRLVGRRPFFPSLSPRKTLEGAVFGTVASVVVGFLMPGVAAAGPDLLRPLSTVDPLALAGLGLALAVVAPAGDLAASFLKRQAGVKDSSDLIPGHGGMLDRLDSLLFAAPVIYYAALVLASGP